MCFDWSLGHRLAMPHPPYSYNPYSKWHFLAPPAFSSFVSHVVSVESLFPVPTAASAIDQRILITAVVIFSCPVTRNSDLWSPELL